MKVHSLVRLLLISLSTSLLLTANGCKAPGSAESIQIATAEFGHYAELGNNLTFVFNSNLAPDSLHQRWIDGELLIFDPPLQGRYRWQSANTLEFAPSKLLSPGTNYKARPGDALRTLNPMLSLPVSGSWEFQTPDLQMQGIDLQWVRPAGAAEPVVEAVLQFNYQVDAARISNLLNVQHEGKRVRHRIVSEDGAHELIRLHLEGSASELTEEQLTVELRPGLLPAGGNRKTDKTFRFVTQIPPRDRLEVRELTAEHSGTKGSVRVVLNQAVDMESVKSRLRISPTVDFELEATARGFRVQSSEFELDMVYQLVLEAGLPGQVDGKLEENYIGSFTFGELEPGIAFTSTYGEYLSANGNRNIGVRISGIETARLRIYKIYENNLIAFFREGIRYGWHYEDGYHDYEYFNTGDFGDLVHEEEIRVADLESQGMARLLKINFDDHINRFEGTYVISLEDDERRWLTASKVVALSDIGIMAKSSEEQVMVFAHSLETAEPLAEAEVSFISARNQKVYKAQTDANGVAILDFLQLDQTGLPEDIDIGLIAIQIGNDYNHLLFRKTAVSTARYDAGGFRTAGKQYDAWLFSERDLYRPGEKVNIAGVVRKLQGPDRALPGQMPVILRFRQPDGTIWKSVRRSLDPQGSFDASLDMPAAAPTGTWSAELYTANDLSLADYAFAVEEFVPDRIRVRSNLNSQILRPGENLTYNLEALNLYGPPASGRNWESELTLSSKTLVSEELPGWNFSVKGTDRVSPMRQEGSTAEDGTAQAEFLIPDEMRNRGLMSGRVLTSVFDETGRPVYDQQNVEIRTQDIYFGLGPFDYYVGTRKLLDIPVAAINADGALQQGATAGIEIITYVWENVLVEGRGRYRYRSERRERVVLEDQIEINGKSSYAFRPERSGRYSVRLHVPGSETYVERSFYAYGWGDTDNSSFSVDVEGRIEIVADKGSYRPGEMANILFKTPFDGKLVVTLERDKVLYHETLETNQRSASLSLRLDDDLAPGAYINATLIRGVSSSRIPLTVAHGIVHLDVEGVSSQLEVDISAPEKSRSRREIEVTLKTEPGAYAAIALVDEGILQITDYESPDPYAHFLRKRALEVDGYDLYKLLFPDLVGSAGLPGGGEGSMLSKRVNPIAANRFELVTGWSGVRKADSKGEVHFKMEVPAFSGELRAMGAAWKDDRYGADSQPITIADPLVVTTGLPRFLTPGDTVDIPVTLANTTEDKIEGKTTLNIGGNLQLLGKTEADISVPAGTERRLNFRAVAGPGIGRGTLEIKATALGEVFDQNIEIAVRPASGLQKRHLSGLITAGESQQFNLGDDLDLLSSGKVVISPSPAVKLADDLEYLLGYPHGCIEQTVSRTFPQIYWEELSLILGTGNMEERAEANYFVNEGIAKIQGMQSSSGALSYWPNGGRTSWWGTVYALHFLTEADKAGFEVNAEVMRRMAGYLRTRLSRREEFQYRYNVSMERTIARKEVPYSLYVLALRGEPDISTMNYYRGHQEKLAMDGRYMLAAAYALAGDMDVYRQVLPSEFKGEESERVFGGSFHSPIRDRGLALSALIEVDPNSDQVARLSTELADMMDAERWLNTQERAFGFLSLGKLAATQSTADVQVKVLANGNLEGQYDGEAMTAVGPDLKDGFELQATGQGTAFYFAEVEGLSSSGSYRQEDNRLQVRKNFYDRNGNRLINLQNLTQGDLVVVRVEISSTDRSVENVAITDIIPAGLEIENSRIREMPDLSWASNASTAEYTDIRDDRISFFVTATRTKRYYYYAARAVSTGSFKMGPIGADAMYNGAYNSYHGAGTVTIRARK